MAWCSVEAQGQLTSLDLTLPLRPGIERENTDPEPNGRKHSLNLMYS